VVGKLICARLVDVLALVEVVLEWGEKRVPGLVADSRMLRSPSRTVGCPVVLPINKKLAK
jgi:hypothetical protein